MDVVSQTGVIQDYQLSVSGTGKGLNYYLSTSYNSNKGIIVGDDFERISVLGKSMRISLIGYRWEWMHHIHKETIRDFLPI